MGSVWGIQGNGLMSCPHSLTLAVSDDVRNLLSVLPCMLRERRVCVCLMGLSWVFFLLSPDLGSAELWHLLDLT